MGNMSGSYGSHYTLWQSITTNSQSVENNTSNVTVRMYLTFDGSSYYAYTNYTTSGSMTINGTTNNYSIASINFSSGVKKDLLLATWTGNISHNANGTKTLNVSGSWNTDTSRIGSGSCSASSVLATIPRASTITCSTANIGSNPTISIKRASDSFTHTITYTYGSGDLKKTGTIATKTGLTTITSWTIPDNFYQNIPNDREGSGSLTCTTYSGNTAIGTSTCNFTVKAVESAARPKVTATLKDTNSTTIALTGDANKLIKGKSTAQLVVTSTLQKYAGSIKSVTVNGGNIGTAASITKTYANVSTASYSIITTDSRNYPSETVTKTASMVNYVPLTLSATIFRPQPTGTEIQMTYSGNYFNGSFGSVANTLSISWKYKVQGASSWTTGGTITPTISGNKIVEATISLGTSYNYQTAYDFQITAVDKLTTNVQTIAVSVGMPVFYWGKDFFRTTVPINGYTLGTACTKGVKTLSAKGDTGWSNQTDGDSSLITKAFIAFWNGAFNSSNSSNLTYCSGGIIQPKPTSLYDNSSGTTGTISNLLESVANFSYIEIFYNCGNRDSMKIDNPNGKTVMLTIEQWVDKKRTFVSKATISGKNITRSENYFVDSDGYQQAYTGIYITKVLGYR